MAENQLAIVSYQDMRKMADDIHKSGMLGTDSPEQALVIMGICQAEGRHPMSVIKRYHIIENKASMRADAMTADFKAAGARIVWHLRTDAICAATFFENGIEITKEALDRGRARCRALMKNNLESLIDLSQVGEETIVRTFADAEQKGLTEGKYGMKTNWRKSPKAMLTARVETEGIRLVDPSIVAGVYTEDELDHTTDQPRNMDDPHERALSQYEIDRRATEEYNARLIAAGEPAEMLEPMPTPPDDDELPGLKNATPAPLPWREVEVVHFTTLKGKKLGELSVTMLEKIKATIEKMGPGQRAGKSGLDAILAGVIEGLKELASKPEEEPAKTEAPSPQSKATPLQQLENLIKGCRIKESELLAYVTKVEKVEYLGLAQLPERIILGMIKNWEGCMEAILNDSAAQ
jgi:hypothetical protein